MTQHPSDRERRAIKHHADRGDESAKNYLALLDACIQVLRGSDGISLARGMMGEHDDTYGEAIDDSLNELMPIIYTCAANGWESLKYYVPQEQAQLGIGEAEDEEGGPERAQRIRATSQKFTSETAALLLKLMIQYGYEAAEQIIETIEREVENVLPERTLDNQILQQALKALDTLYYKSYEYDQDGGASYEQAREQLERQVRPLGFTLSFAECGDIGAGTERRNYGAMKHVLVPRDRELEATDSDPH